MLRTETNVYPPFSISRTLLCVQHPRDTPCHTKMKAGSPRFPSRNFRTTCPLHSLNNQAECSRIPKESDCYMKVVNISDAPPDGGEDGDQGVPDFPAVRDGFLLQLCILPSLHALWFFIVLHFYILLLSPMLIQVCPPISMSWFSLYVQSFS